MSRHSNQILIRCSCWADSMTKLFEEVYNDFPYARAFRVRAGPPNESVGDSLTSKISKVRAKRLSATSPQ